MLQKTPKGFDAHRFPLGFEDNLGVNLLGHGNGVKIHVDDLSAHRMMLDFLDERGPVADRGSLANFQINEDVLADGA